MRSLFCFHSKCFTFSLVHMVPRLRPLLYVFRRYKSEYVDRMRTLDHWQLHDESLVSEFPRGRFLLMVDRKPLIKRNNDEVKLVISTYPELKSKLSDYGLQVEISNSCLIDAIDTEGEEGMPAALFGTAVRTVELPEDSPISLDQVRNQLGRTLNGQFIDLRMAMLTMQGDKDRNWLARMQTLSRWARVYRRCPKCASALKMRVSKSGAECLQCQRVYYPTYSPVAICILTDPTNEHCLLVRHRGSANGVYTAIAGFAVTGEPLQETCRREVAEEVGLECEGVRQLGFSQPWPMPDSSLMVAFTAIADMQQEIRISVDELEAARWFSREEVGRALAHTDADPFLRGISRDPEIRQTLQYIPPRGAIAYQMIRKWVHKELR